MDPKRKRLTASIGQSLEWLSHFLGINLSSYIGRLYSFALVMLFCLFTKLSWHDICVDYCREHLGRKVMITLQHIMYTLLVLTLVGTSIFRPKQFVFPRHEIDTVDSILESYGAQFSSKEDSFFVKHRHHLQDASITIIILTNLIKLIYDIINAGDSLHLIWLAMHSWYSLNCLLTIDGLFIHYVNDVYVRFHKLNKIAEKHWREKLSVAYIHFTVANRGEAFNKRNNTIVTKIRSIQHVYHRLYILASKVNKNFGLQLLIASTISLNAIILFLHDIYYNVKLNSSTTEMFVLNITFVLCHTLRSLYISYICQRSRNESRQMAKILHSVFLKYKSLRAEVVQFSLQMVHEDLTFTAYGFYEINMPFMCSTAGAIFTYLVMVIQLDDETKFNLLNTTWGYTDNSSSTSNTS